MELLKVFHMNGGIGENSYADNSYLQKKVISMSMPMMEEAIARFYTSALPATLAIADLGCSSGPNTLFAVSEMIKAVQNLCEKIGSMPPEYQIFLNDLPGNDFNSLFKSLSNFLENDMRKQTNTGEPPKCFFMGVPGSFYGRLFPSKSLQFVHSSYSVHWLSKVPEGIEDNRGNIYITRTSPPNVLEAYYKQFRKDFATFLECRAEELVSGGGMVLTLAGRKSTDPSKGEYCCIWDPLASALGEMVSEGLIEEDLNNFNVPLYTPSLEEVKLAIENQESFSLYDLAVSEVNLRSYEGEVDQHDSFIDDVLSLVKQVRAVAEPLLLNHFGDEIIEDCFGRYKKLIFERISYEKTELVNFTVSLIRS